MKCHHCQHFIGNKENYIQFRIPGKTPLLFFHDRHADDCWMQFVRINPTIRIMEVTEGGLIEHKTEYYA